jgi:inner membrane protein involved in colicin E2 resistance
MIESHNYKKVAWTTAFSVAITLIVLGWYIFGSWVTPLDLTNHIQQFIFVGVGIVVMFIAMHILSKPGP